MAASPLAAGDNMVRLMTMHKSKGLQFPVVFCLGLEKSITGGRHGKDAGLQMDEELGLALHYKVLEQRLSRKTAADRKRTSRSDTCRRETTGPWDRKTTWI